jgi:hypothetical protein
VSARKLAEVNDRQRAYLLAIFAVDQELEAEMRSLPYRPFQPRPKASEWRWLEYSEPVPEIDKPASQLYAAIKKTAPIDQGTGATFAALADRGLVEVDWREQNVWGQRKPYIRLTPTGRRLARSWTGQKAQKAPPAGTLREWHWRALAKAYAAGDEGLDGSYGDYANIGWNTWLRLRDYKLGPLAVGGRGALIEEVDARGHPGLGIGPYRLRITANGRALYESEWARYRELYPEVADAPEPARAGAGRAWARREESPISSPGEDQP